MKKFNTAYVTAIVLAAIGASVSLSGLVMMFGLAFLPIGVGLEVGKLVAADALHRTWSTLDRGVRYGLTSIVVALMILTSSGIYGFTLTRYLAHVAAITAPVAQVIAAADENVRRQADKVADLNKQITDVDAASAPTSAPQHTGKPAKASAINAQASADAAAAKQRIADDQRRQAKRDTLTGKRDTETVELSRLRNVRAAAGSVQQAAEAEIGPVKIVADLLGIDPGKVVAATVAAVFDAMCVLLLLVGRSRKPAVIEAPATAVARAKETAGKQTPARRQPAKRTREERSIAARKGWEKRHLKIKAAQSRGPVAVK